MLRDRLRSAMLRPGRRFAASCAAFAFLAAISPSLSLAADDSIRVEEDADSIRIETNALKATIKKKGYVSGIAAGTFVDKKTGAVDRGFGLDIVDWVMTPGSDESYRDQLPKRMVYETGNAWHGDDPKRCLEGPQICTEAEELSPRVVRGEWTGGEFVAVEQDFTYKLAAPGRKPGSVWKQTLVFDPHHRYVLACDEVTLLEGGKELFLRTDLPGHIKHEKGDSFSDIYLSYLGVVPSSEFAAGDFTPQAKFRYRRAADESNVPDRMIRGYRTRDPKTGEAGPWLAGMTLDPRDVYEGWCHERGYVCMIQEIGGRDYAAGDKIQAAYVIGWFDHVDEMAPIYDRYRGIRSFSVVDGRLTFEKSAQQQKIEGSREELRERATELPKP